MREVGPAVRDRCSTADLGHEGFAQIRVAVALALDHTAGPGGRQEIVVAGAQEGRDGLGPRLALVRV